MGANDRTKDWQLDAAKPLRVSARFLRDTSSKANILCSRRLKDNFSIIKEEDRPRLLEAKEKVEREMANMKWTLIADKVKASGGDQYTVILPCLP